VVWLGRTCHLTAKVNLQSADPDLAQAAFQRTFGTREMARPASLIICRHGPGLGKVLLGTTPGQFRIPVMTAPVAQ
jgi:hypothetical protein